MLGSMVRYKETELVNIECCLRNTWAHIGESDDDGDDDDDDDDDETKDSKIRVKRKYD